MMKFYKDAQDTVYAYAADGSQVDYIKPGLSAITAEQAEAIRNPPKSLPESKAIKLREIDVARNAAEQATVTVQGKPFPATEQFQAKVSRALNYVGRGKPLDLTDAWRDSNAQAVTMSPVLLGQIEDAITANGVAAWKKYWLKFDEVMAAQTSEAVDAVTW